MSGFSNAFVALLFFGAAVNAAPVTRNDVFGMLFKPQSVSFPVVRDVKSDPEDVLFEGDILGVMRAGDTDADLALKLQGLSKSGVLETLRWPGGYGFYYISTSFSSSRRAEIERALREFDKTDAFKWYPWDSSRANYVYIQPHESECTSYVGMQDGGQYVNLAPGCDYTAIVHELMHAAGFWHEQSRSDRDTYVEINKKNIQPGMEHNFDKYESSQITTFGHPYDYSSIMHYETNAFAVDPKIWTIRPKAPYQNYQISKGVSFSPTDLKDLNSMYPLCAETWLDSGRKGIHSTYVKNVQYNLDVSEMDKITSFIVTYPCTLTLYSLNDYKGTSQAYRPTNSTHNYWDLSGTQQDNDARSVKCTC